MGVQISLFDDLPDFDPVPTAPATVYAEPNASHDHLLIESGGHDYVFVNMGSVVTFGHFSGPTVELYARALRTIGNYCLNQAQRLETLNDPPF